MDNLDHEKTFITEKQFNVEKNYFNETIFALSNGFIGTRGTFEESVIPRGKGIEGNFINGFYESEKIKYGEKGYAFANVSQTMLNVANAKIIKVEVDGEEFSLTSSKIIDYVRKLDLTKGILTRNCTLQGENGKTIKIETERFVSMERKNLFVISYKLTAQEDMSVVLKSLIDGDVKNSTPETNARIDYGPYGRVLKVKNIYVDQNQTILKEQTKNTHFNIVTAVENEISGNEVKCSDILTKFSVGKAFTFNLHSGESVTLNKYIVYTTQTDTPHNNLEKLAKKLLNSAVKDGYSQLKNEQIAFYKDFWDNADMEIYGDDELEQGIRFNVFHLLQGAGRDGKTSIGAKCLTGEGYEGHCFWDTEMYALPYFLYNKPSIAKSFIEFRYNTLPQARIRAKELSSPNGALYPWRTINGFEASPYYPAGTAQFHINGDIAFAVQKYFDVTNDTDLFVNKGAEIIIETARFYASYGAFIKNKGNKFCINCVTGPDEYTALVNNNCYTNMIARENFKNAYKAVHYLKENYSEKYELLKAKIELKDEEVNSFKVIYQNMYLPYDKELGVYLQDDSFLDKADFDIKSVPKDKLPIADHFHFLYLYSRQVLKQADLLLATFIMNENFTTEEIKRNYDFYEPRTIHESSLSQCVHSIVASKIGYKEMAYKFFRASARLDLDDVQKNTYAGIHMANLAGAWMCIVNGFGGLEQKNGKMSLCPQLPEKWLGYKFKLNYKNSLIEVSVKKDYVELKVLKGENVQLYVYGKLIELGSETFKVLIKE